MLGIQGSCSSAGKQIMQITKGAFPVRSATNFVLSKLQISEVSSGWLAGHKSLSNSIMIYMLADIFCYAEKVMLCFNLIKLSSSWVSLFNTCKCIKINGMIDNLLDVTRQLSSCVASV